ncbi:hypothetical protein F511_00587 [Dorcoceras hygrometricum]|uniref:Uncharacterized protein n=1 Tax=Dorcoceras hygrometricum TaxID=472368 RepID=A0A2Z7BBB2_9LAMI|nr:hypothetical protein F511_00587 [Dorcoceras hygrometricum]
MAIEVFPDKYPSLVTSPRISFSHDLSPDNVGVPILRANKSSIDFDFDFCIFNQSFGQESSSADELFSDGKILPIQIKKPPQPPPPPPSPSAPPPPPAGRHTTTPYSEARKPISESEEIKRINKSSFWGFKRSTSLNGGSGQGRGLCPLPLLSRSNSTGSNSSVKRPGNMKQNLVRSSSCGQQRPPLKKGILSSYDYGVKIHPVLNVPPVNLFGVGSIFSYGGTKKSKNR